MINLTVEQLLEKALDITAPYVVEVKIRNDGKVIWVNVDGVCALRICRIKHLHVDNEFIDHD